MQSKDINPKLTVLPGLAGPMPPVKVNTLAWNICLCWNASSMGQDGWQSHNYGLLASEAGVNMGACSSCCRASAFCNQSARCLLRSSRSIGSEQEWSCGSSCRCSGIWSLLLSIAWHTPCPRSGTPLYAYRQPLPFNYMLRMLLNRYRHLPYKHRPQRYESPARCIGRFRLP